MQSRKTKAGAAIRLAPSRMAVLTSLPCSRCQLMFSMVTGGVVDQDADGQGQAAQGHDVEGLAGRPTAPAMAARTDSGIEIAMITVERQLPRNSRIMTLVRAAAMTPSWITPVDRALHEQRLVVQRRDVELGGQGLLQGRQARLDARRRWPGSRPSRS